MIRSLLLRLLPIFAIVGMITVPIAAPVGIGAMAVETVTTSSEAGMSGMPCCPNHQQQKMLDCGKATCPLMALCMAKCFPEGPVATFVPPLPVIEAMLIGLRAEPQLASLAPSPPIRPPRI
jgi:hypothetical protein